MYKRDEKTKLVDKQRQRPCIRKAKALFSVTLCLLAVTDGMGNMNTARTWYRMFPIH
jgi:hypothetical protein